MSDLKTPIQVETWAIDRLIPYARNPRRNDRFVDQMCASIREFGFKIPCLVRSDGELVDGDLRLKAARKLGITEVPVILCDEWTPAQVKAFRLLVNRSATWADWDEELLATELAEIQGLDFDLSLTGFDVREIEELLARPTNEQAANAVPALPEVATSQPGDLWLLGSHRVLCGDATEPSYLKRIEGHRNTSISSDTRADWSEAFALVPSLQVAYVWHASKFTREVLDGLQRIGFVHHQQIIWNKGRTVLTRTHYWFQHEPCWYVRKKNAPWYGKPGENSTIWDSPSPKFILGGSDEDKFDHPTQKPLEVMRRPIVNHTKRGELVYDPFLGSGTTLVAAELTGRVCCGLELDPKYVDVIVERWQRLNGAQARLEGNNVSFEEMRSKRRVETGPPVEAL
jgi:hypothetical protein